MRTANRTYVRKTKVRAIINDIGNPLLNELIDILTYLYIFLLLRRC